MSADDIADGAKGTLGSREGLGSFEPQVDPHTLIDLQSLRWPALQVSADGLEIAATCTLEDPRPL